MRTAGKSALKPDGRYTVADYKSWNDDVRRELIDGVIYDMSAALVWHLDGSRFAPVTEYLEGGEIHSSAIAGFTWKTARATKYT